MKGIYNRIFTVLIILVLLCSLTGCSTEQEFTTSLRGPASKVQTEDDVTGTAGTYTVCIGSTDEKNDYIGTWYGERYTMIISDDKVIMTDNGETVINTELRSDDGFLYFDDYMYHTNAEEAYGYVGEAQLLDDILIIYVTDRERDIFWGEYELSRQLPQGF